MTNIPTGKRHIFEPYLVHYIVISPCKLRVQFQAVLSNVGPPEVALQRNDTQSFHLQSIMLAVH